MAPKTAASSSVSRRIKDAHMKNVKDIEKELDAAYKKAVADGTTAEDEFETPGEDVMLELFAYLEKMDNGDRKIAFENMENNTLQLMYEYNMKLIHIEGVQAAPYKTKYWTETTDTLYCRGYKFVCKAVFEKECSDPVA